MITLKEVVVSFEKTGLTPTYGITYCPSAHTGCAIGALALASDPNITDSAIAWEAAENLYGQGFRLIHFAYGFDDGFEGSTEGDCPTPEYHNGYEIGQEIRKLFSAETVEESVKETVC